ncbi:autophagy protein 5-like [Limulus polyphemus]|uniref:Autophagy protein 5 n=1 Tax=Limulus polyphemus TaxID=6850 RepID=A0ABM1SKI3_LIMPO|nr:autophagy protein 5-like [Limulus polyphemus]XP_013776738.1 autophagy protein 5-like [Limulus polyphemus]XP_022244138.1 autophagy protein 5-like [Limulus polyphemus]XP_022244139.1 autophagy protein 5-like [Limulus polyphemus]
MAEDREVMREVWDGRLPVCFRLSVEEVNTVQQPDPFYLMVPRLTYFPLVTDKVQRHFSRHISEPDQGAEMWLDYDGQPIKWHYPVGLLFDLYGLGSQLPWNLTVHFKNFPEEELVHCPSRAAIESHFMATIKEADFLKHRGMVISAMQKKDHNQLWLGLQNDKFDQFWAINRKLMEHTNDELFKYIPYRLYQPDMPYIQRLVRPLSEKGENTTLLDLLHVSLPKFSKEDILDNVQIVAHGIKPPMDTPLQWMSEHLSYPDNFLHLCIHQT